MLTPATFSRGTYINLVAIGSVDFELRSFEISYIMVHVNNTLVSHVLGFLGHAALESVQPFLHNVIM